MPASRIAAFTPSATFSTIAGRPISSGLSSLLMAVPMVRRGFEAGPVLSWRAKIVAWGVMTPSQPPDHTIGMSAISASPRRPLLSSTRRNAWSARMRVKSFTPPLPSVLPITAMTWSAVNWPWRIQASSPEASCTLFSSTFATSMAILLLPRLFCLPSGRTRPRHHLAAEHLLVAFAAIDDRPVLAAAGLELRPQGKGRRFVERERVRAYPRRQHNAVIIARRGKRHFALDHVAQDQIRLARERVAPAAAAGGEHAHDLTGQHRFAIDQPAEVARRTFDIDRQAERKPSLAAVHAVAAEPHAIGRDDGPAVHQRAVMLFVAEPAAPRAGAAGIRAQRELLDQQRKSRLGEFGRLIARVRHDVDGVVTVGVITPARPAAQHLAGEERLAGLVDAVESGVADGLLVRGHAPVHGLGDDAGEESQAAQQHEGTRVGGRRPFRRDQGAFGREDQVEDLAHPFIDVDLRRALRRVGEV